MFVPFKPSPPLRPVNECILLAACLTLDFALIAASDGFGSWTQYLAIIAVLGQVLTVSLLAATRRGSVSPVIAILLASLIGGGLLSRVSDQPWTKLTTAMMLAAVAVYWSARLVAAKFPAVLPREGQATAAAMRFSIARVMIWTAIVAVVLAVVRLVEFERADAAFIPAFVLVSVFGMLAGGIAILGREVSLRLRASLLAAAFVPAVVLVFVLLDAEHIYGAILVAWLLLLLVRILRGRRRELDC